MLALFPIGVLAKLTLFPTGIEVGMGPLIKKFFVCMFFLLNPSPIPGTGELCSHHFYQNITFVLFFIFLFFFYIIQVTDSISHWLMLEWIIKGMNEEYLDITTLFFSWILPSVIFLFFLLIKNKMFIAKICSSLQVQLITHPHPG